MVEMRWLVRDGWDGPERVLQYRQMLDKRVFAGFPPENYMPKLEWSEWKDVPAVKEDHE